jgi:hypothetical protein
MKQSISSILVILSILFSMTEISKVAVLGYTMFTDGEKAAHFCTCMGCSHSTDTDKESCMVDMGSNHSQDEESEPMHCNMTQSANGTSICGCDSSPTGEKQILFNTLDKTGLLAGFHYSSKEIKKSIEYLNRVEHPVSVQQDIFHPPRA